jgi:hypothetical protein
MSYRGTLSDRRLNHSALRWVVACFAPSHFGDCGTAGVCARAAPHPGHAAPCVSADDAWRDGREPPLGESYRGGRLPLPRRKSTKQLAYSRFIVVKLSCPAMSARALAGLPPLGRAGKRMSLAFVRAPVPPRRNGRADWLSEISDI